MQKNDNIELEITGMTADGSGIGRYEGMAVFVPGTAAGDRVTAHILKVKKNCAYAKLIDVLTPSADRAEPDCDIFSRCGGCVYRHISYAAECREKTEKVRAAVNRIGGIPLEPQPIISAVKTCGYRNKAQYPVGIGGEIGFYAVHSHRIINCNSCRLQPEIFDKIIFACREWINDYRITAYDGETHRGLLRHIYIRIAEKTDEIMFTAVINGKKLPFSDELILKLKAVCKDALKSVQININRENTNVILGNKCVVLYGEPYITDVLCGLKIRLSPLSFYQVNRDMAELLYKKAAEYAKPDGKNIVDLYCGAGTIGLSMAASAKSVVGVEIVSEAVEDARFNADLNNIKNARFICADASEAAEKLALEGLKPDVVIIDPPRKGCQPELIDIIATRFSPERVVYVSCDPATLARDAARFAEKGYELCEYTPVDLFPRTAHVECAALFEQMGNL